LSFFSNWSSIKRKAYFPSVQYLAMPRFQDSSRCFRIVFFQAALQPDTPARKNHRYGNIFPNYFHCFPAPLLCPITIFINNGKRSPWSGGATLSELQLCPHPLIFFKLLLHHHDFEMKNLFFPHGVFIPVLGAARRYHFVSCFCYYRAKNRFLACLPNFFKSNCYHINRVIDEMRFKCLTIEVCFFNKKNKINNKAKQRTTNIGGFLQTPVNLDHGPLCT